MANTPPGADLSPIPTIEMEALLQCAAPVTEGENGSEAKSTTQVAIAYLGEHRYGATSRRIEEAVKVAAHQGSSVMLDSHAIADLIFDERVTSDGEASWGQTKDYVQHILREAPHVCRHADGHFYRVHTEEICSDQCDARWASRLKALDVARAQCPDCFTMLPKSGVCDCGY